MPARAARALRRRCRSSGTLRIWIITDMFLTLEHAGYMSILPGCCPVLFLFSSDRRSIHRSMSKDSTLIDGERRRGRGARSNRVGRYESELREAFDDGWESLGELEPFKTEVARETARSII